MVDLPPTEPGFILNPIYLYYRGSVDREIPVAGMRAVGLEARSNSLTLGALYAFEKPLLGATTSVGAYLPYVWMDVEGYVETQLPGALIRREDSDSGLGDITLIPALMAWNSGKWTTSLILSFYAPTGSYEVGRLANLGLNYWTFDPTIAFSYADEESGFNFALFTGVTFNTENSDTDYKSGSVLHAEVSVQKILPLGSAFATLGLNGFIYEQISGDSGSGASLGDFKGSSIGIGPVLGYIRPTKKGMFIAELKWLPELSSTRRLEGDWIWLKTVFTF
jgi:hypothetical protein